MIKLLRSLFLDWVNNWNTLGAFCEHHEIDRDDAITLIELGRKYQERHMEAVHAKMEGFK